MKPYGERVTGSDIKKAYFVKYEVLENHLAAFNVYEMIRKNLNQKKVLLFGARP